MSVDRKLQKEILVHLKTIFPESITLTSLREDRFEKKSFEFNIMYLVDHNLVRRTSSGQYIINAKGIDFIEDDGGLSAILNTVTVKFDAENIRSLMEAELLKANLPEEEKSGIMATLRKLPGKALETVTLELIKKALADPTEILSVIRSVLGPDTNC
ncbi:MAG TPA: hypothetical protein VE028_01135 [Nitratidesulfovibrio sp.]|nr:hypothetical protein [Nitratidesulfovibrio sp.]